MPLYEYECPKCGNFDKIRKFSDPPLKKCPTCGSPITKVLSAPAIQFKGAGWYVNDYAKKSKGSESSESKDSESKGSDSKASESKGRDSKGSDSKSSDSKSSDSKSSEAKSKAKTDKPSTKTDAK